METMGITCTTLEFYDGDVVDVEKEPLFCLTQPAGLPNVDDLFIVGERTWRVGHRTWVLNYDDRTGGILRCLVQLIAVESI